MKALVYSGCGKIVFQEHADPTIQTETDAIVKIVKTTICGTDLHIVKGDVPSCTPGRVLGHEAIGVVHAIGSAVTTFKVGGPVLVSCITSCSKCEFCKKGMYSHCVSGGWILGNIIDGTQAEYVRIPYADTSLYPIPNGVEEEALVMLSDILPTGFECGVLNAKVEPGCTLAIVGAGPVGLAALESGHRRPAAIVTETKLIEVNPGVVRDSRRGRLRSATGAYSRWPDRPVAQLISSLCGDRFARAGCEEHAGIPLVQIDLENRTGKVPNAISTCRKDILLPISLHLCSQ